MGERRIEGVAVVCPMGRLSCCVKDEIAWLMHGWSDVCEIITVRSLGGCSSWSEDSRGPSFINLPS